MNNRIRTSTVLRAVSIVLGTFVSACADSAETSVVLQPGALEDSEGDALSSYVGPFCGELVAEDVADPAKFARECEPIRYIYVESRAIDLRSFVRDAHAREQANPSGNTNDAARKVMPDLWHLNVYFDPPQRYPERAHLWPTELYVEEGGNDRTYGYIPASRFSGTLEGKSIYVAIAEIPDPTRNGAQRTAQFWAYIPEWLRQSSP